MASQEDIVDQQTQLATYRGNLKILLRQASKFGGEEDAPLHIINGIRDTRENIRRIKQNLHGWDVKVDDLPDETPPALANAVAGSSTAPYPAGPGSVAHVNQKSEQPYKYDVFISYSHEDEDWV